MFQYVNIGESPQVRDSLTWIGQLYQQRWKSILSSIALLYLLSVSLLRYRRLNNMTLKLRYQDRASLSRMTTADAQAIMIYLSELEFPTVFYYSVAFALFKVCGRLLIASRLSRRLGSPG